MKPKDAPLPPTEQTALADKPGTDEPGTPDSAEQGATEQKPKAYLVTKMAQYRGGALVSPGDRVPWPDGEDLPSWLRKDS